MNVNERTASAFRISYAIGIVLCIVWPLVIQVLMGTLIQRPALPAGDFVKELGYTFTGLSAVAALFIWLRMKKALETFATLQEAQQASTVMKETLLAAALFELSAAYGLIYYVLGGPDAGRYSRTFALLPTLMFIVFVPRLSAWQRAAKQP
jgi:predicted lysophospholipase L1 biosynthesis ABC-type transport system permease subunit